MVVEPGGPGGSGTNLIWRKGKDFSDSFTDGEFDVLGFDPRGEHAFQQINFNSC